MSSLCKNKIGYLSFLSKGGLNLKKGFKKAVL